MVHPFVETIQFQLSAKSDNCFLPSKPLMASNGLLLTGYPLIAAISAISISHSFKGVYRLYIPCPRSFFLGCLVTHCLSKR